MTIHVEHPLMAFRRIRDTNINGPRTLKGPRSHLWAIEHDAFNSEHARDGRMNGRRNRTMPAGSLDSTVLLFLLDLFSLFFKLRALAA